MFFFKIQVHCSHYYFSFFMHWFCSISVGAVNFDMPLTVHCRYRRFPDHHEFVDDLFCHSDDVEDMDISPYDECILLFPLVGVHIIISYNNYYLFIQHLVPGQAGGKLVIIIYIRSAHLNKCSAAYLEVFSFPVSTVGTHVIAVQYFIIAKTLIQLPLNQKWRKFDLGHRQDLSTLKECLS